MNPSEALHNHRDAVRHAARRAGAHEVRGFGSVVHGQDTDDIDLDLLMDVPRGATLLNMVRLQKSIADKLGVPVDVLTVHDLPPRCRERVVQEAQPI